MYLFWLHKPQDIHVPTPIRSEGMEAACAYAWMCSELSSQELHDLCYYPDVKEPQISPQSVGISLTTESLDHGGLLDSEGIVTIQSTQSVRTALADNLDHGWLLDSEGIVTLRHGEILPGTQLGPASRLAARERNKLVKLRKGKSEVDWLPTTRIENQDKMYVDKTSSLRWRLASSFIRDNLNFQAYSTSYPPSSVNLRNITNDDTSPFLVMSQIPNWPKNLELLSSFPALPLIIISITTGLYGGLHATA